MNKKGITLIELIIFIIVGGMFIPLAYISFTALTSNLVRPETAAIIKAIAETKMNDINSTAYDCRGPWYIPTLGPLGPR